MEVLTKPNTCNSPDRPGIVTLSEAPICSDDLAQFSELYFHGFRDSQSLYRVVNPRSVDSPIGPAGGRWIDHRGPYVSYDQGLTWRHSPSRNGDNDDSISGTMEFFEGNVAVGSPRSGDAS